MLVVITDAAGEQRSGLTNTFGYYHFAEVPAGESYIFTVSSRRYTFVNSSQVVSVADADDDINFVAEQ